MRRWACGRCTNKQSTWAAEASSVTGMPMTPNMWRTPRRARVCATTVYPLPALPPPERKEGAGLQHNAYMVCK